MPKEGYAKLGHFVSIPLPAGGGANETPMANVNVIGDARGFADTIKNKIETKLLQYGRLRDSPDTPSFKRDYYTGYCVALNEIISDMNRLISNM